MLTKEYKEYERKAESLYGVFPTAHKVATLILAQRMKTTPDNIQKMSARDTKFNEERLKLIEETAPAKLHISGKAPWIVRVSECDKCLFICECEEYADGEVLCELRDVLVEDLEYMTAANQPEIMVGKHTLDWEWSVYISVNAVIDRIRTSPLSQWNALR